MVCVHEAHGPYILNNFNFMSKHISLSSSAPETLIEKFQNTHQQLQKDPLHSFQLILYVP